MIFGSTRAAKRPRRAYRSRSAAGPPAPLAGVNTARGRNCSSGRSLSSLELVVALEGDAVDDRILGHPHDQRIAVAPQLTSENSPVAYSVFRLRSSLSGSNGSPGSPACRTGSCRLDALVALHLDGGDGAPGRRRPRGRRLAARMRPGTGAVDGVCAPGQRARDPTSQQHDNRQTVASSAARVRQQKRCPLMQRQAQSINSEAQQRGHQ